MVHRLNVNRKQVEKSGLHRRFWIQKLDNKENYLDTHVMQRIKN